MEQFKVITITYKNVGLSDLGKYIIPKGEDHLYEEKLRSLKESFGLGELMYLLTCNRVMYFFTSEEAISDNFLKDFFSFINPALTEEELGGIKEIAQIYQGFESVKHLLEVSCSLDSLVLGEREIPKQIRLAYEECHKLGLTKDKIRVAVKAAVQTAKRTFTETKISHKPVSVVSLATDQLMKLHLDKNARILIIGAGDTNNMMAKYLLKHGFVNYTVFNRTLRKAKGLAAKLGRNVAAYTLEELYAYKGGFDILITCTGATEPIVDAELYRHLLNGEKDEKVIMDLAIPYDIDAEVIERYKVKYIEIEQLRSIAEKNLEFRRSEMGVAREIIREEMETFKVMYHHRQIELAMRGVTDQIKDIREHAVSNVFSKDVENMDPASREVMEKVLDYLEKKYIGIPIKVAKEAFVPREHKHFVKK